MNVYPFNLDCVKDHEKLTKEHRALMAKLEEEDPCTSRDQRRSRYEDTYKELRKNYKTYRELGYSDNVMQGSVVNSHVER